MKLKYSTDEYGNVYSNVAQVDQIDGSVLFNDRIETLDIPITPDKGKRLIVENGKWKQIDISPEHTTEEKDGIKFFRPKTQIERYVTGVDDIPKGMKLSDDKKELITKTLDEQLSSGEITQSEYNEIYNQPVKYELNDIDIKSVRSLREWLVQQPDCPEFLKTYEKEATAKRSELKK
jgi:hypothetical protein